MHEVEEMVEDFEHADEAEAHAEAEEPGRGWDEGQGGDTLLPADPGVERVPDEHLQHQGVVLGVVEQELGELLKLEQAWDT